MSEERILAEMKQLAGALAARRERSVAVVLIEPPPGAYKGAAPQLVMQDAFRATNGVAPDGFSRTLLNEPGPDGKVVDGQRLVIRIDEPEFLEDMAKVGREIMRCFGRASQTFNFMKSVLLELDGLHQHLASVNQIPEAILVNAAAELLRAGGDRVPETTSKLGGAVVPGTVSQAPPAATLRPDVSAEAKAQYADLPQSFFKPTTQAAAPEETRRVRPKTAGSRREGK